MIQVNVQPTITQLYIVATGTIDYNALMIDEKLARFESNIERLVENAFASFFGKRIHAQDIALELARAMESDLRSDPEDNEGRPFAPDYYVIKLNPHLHYQINARQPNLAQTLAQHMVQLAMTANYRLANIPIVIFENDTQLERSQFIVKASHSDKQMHATAGMQRVTFPIKENSRRVSAQLLINTDRAVKLNGSIINIGRQQDNDIVIEDGYVSRHHLQIRKRFDDYILFDINSRCGTKVNNSEVKEHRLQPGDVITIGNTTIVYLEDGGEDIDLPKTQPLE